jgi:hypothetical protein
MKNTRLLLLLAAVLLAGAAHAPDHNAPVILVKNGRPHGRIILTTHDPVDRQAATILQDFIRRISGAQLEIRRATASRPGDIIIGAGAPNDVLPAADLSDDGFRIVARRRRLHIVGGGDKGVLYGALTLLERFMGVRYWGDHEYTITPAATIALPAVDLAENPAFRYRQSQHYAMASDSLYTPWMRLESPHDVFAGGYWVHTFDLLLPSAVYGDAHPEYYSYFNGRRHPGKASQWCLSNPDVLEIVAAKIDSIFHAHPGKQILSVSQNDGNYTNCQCEHCKALDDHEGAPSGSLIHFLNKLADRFPDKQLSTLAYLYTMKPPKHVKPRRNVNIMLCSIDCHRELSLTETPSGQEFVEALEGWSRISDNIFVWDYGINFDNYLTPFPNFHILADNLRLFKKNNVTMHFSQIAGVRGGDFAEMRTWMVAKLMWNPRYDADSLMTVFLEGYYGAGAPYLYRYVKLLEGALMGSGQRLWIYDSPVSHKQGMLKPALMRRYADLFDRAEAAVADDSVRLARVRRTRLSLLYSELDIARTDPPMDTAAVARKLALFEQRVAQFNVPSLNERDNAPLEYAALYRTRYMPRNEPNAAAGATVRFIIPPTGRYAAPGATALTDGLYGGATFGESWIGWEGTDGAFVLDLGEPKTFSEIRTDFLHQLGAWILLPLRVDYSVSDDGVAFRKAGAAEHPEDRDRKVKFLELAYQSPQPLTARYIKVEVTGVKVCPHWHYGVGHPCWFFIDEVVVK